MRKITVCDRTMKHSSEVNGIDLSFREKLELAKLLDRLNLDVIELPEIKDFRTDSLLIKSISNTLHQSALAVPIRLTDRAEISRIWDTLKNAPHARLQVEIPVSTVQMEYLWHIKPNMLEEKVRTFVSECVLLCHDTEFLALDVSRADPETLKNAITYAVDSGAHRITLCDSSGTLLPDEAYNSVKEIRSLLPESVRLGVSFANDISLADACAVSALKAGADEVKVCSFGDATTNLASLAQIIRLRGESLNLSSGLQITEINRISQQIQRLFEGHRNTSSVVLPSSASDAGESSISAMESRASVLEAIRKLGYELDLEDQNLVFESFKSVASKKEKISLRELDAIVASSALQVPPTYLLESYLINSSNIIASTAHLRLKKDDQILEGLSVGDGPVDAAFLAIENIIGCHYELDDFQIRSVTEGQEAMGETIVRLRNRGQLYSGRGISTDIIGSSISAYLNALNKIVYEEANP